ncbi:Transmembrane protein, TqsA-like [Desulfonema limicola]|uniref:Transmembrane protein, TqsA-like n=1 Tax=Desulfonema limicola TaxID=45656 RepID=A0A975B8T4_9BACT|nr:AI-2E family transporter [Desulfonema limicola]QTA80690.1 Transmembrane protein, TqsA-like [Desulfonema limicola]
MSDFKIADPLLRRLLYAVGIMGVIAFGFYTFSLLQNAVILILNVLTPFIAALLLAYILAPIVITLQNHLKMGRIMGTLVLYMIIFIAVFLLFFFLIPNVISEFIRLFNVLKTAFPPLLDKLADNSYFKIDSQFIDIIQKHIDEIKFDYEQLAAALLPGLKKMASGGLEAVGIATRGIFTGLGSVFSFFSFLIFVGIVNFYFIIDWEKISPLIHKMIHPEKREQVFDILKKIDIAVGGFLRGQLTVSAIVGSCFAVGLFAMGFIGFPALRNYCILIGTAAAIGGFVPYLGPVMGVTPAILIIILTGGVTWTVKLISLVSVLVLFSIIQAIEGFILQPRIVGKGAGLHPLAVMFALLFGSQFGIGGMIIAVPLASIIRVLILEFYWLPIEAREAELSSDSD